MKASKFACIAALGAAVAAWSGSAVAHGVVGRRGFLEPFVTEDANPKDEIVLARPAQSGGGEGEKFVLEFSLEKKLGERLSLGLEAAWTRLEPREAATTSGFQNLGVLLKYAALRNGRHEAIVSPAFEVELPVGDAEVGAETTAALAPALLFGKGLGDLPRRLGLLRPLAVMGDARFEIVTGRRNTPTTLAYDFLLMYSIPYLDAFVAETGLPWPLRRAVPLVELNFESGIHGRERRTEARITPGVVYLGRLFQLGLAGQFPANGTAARELDWGVMAIVDLFYDDLIPRVAQWHLFR